MEENKQEMLSPEMAKLIVKQILNKHNIKKEDIGEISEEEKERLKEMALNFKSQVDALLKNQKNDTKVKKAKSVDKLSEENEPQKRMSLKDRIRQRRGR
ncbi:hypothetical protein [Metabacillus fastidiosus]|uniref:Spore coat protein n=1 Tax=Metabacillus fastidiosus TaxID=1458 RepID=A0ABU6P1K1_9BACI|nr:hypothetical protein [Metabacillus fastidiosus]MED4403234.1 hypothetical protein [Metabacillus fastidiosus]MED4455469.1 hypothetical protein [Metabacillus fastidiosus]MED4461658.1 hypothetical protein [Metabacillus fastidiosus]